MVLSSSRTESSKVVLDISIVGAGLGGLTAAYLLGKAGHRVTVFEAAPELGEIGAGIQMSPNVTRLFQRWGLGEKLEKASLVPSGFSMRRYRDGKVLGWQPFGDAMEKSYHAPYYHIHRADLHNILLDAAQSHSKIRVNAKVVGVNPGLPSITLESGETIKSDLVVGADGIHSRVRELVFKYSPGDGPMPTGDATYRALVPISQLKDDKELLELVNDGMTCWMGPDKHIIAYNIRGEVYNIGLTHPLRNSTDVAPRSIDPDTMRKDFAEFEPRIQRLLSYITTPTMEWTLMDCEPLKVWVHDDKVCLLGDACHPMLPYRAQGAAMAIEDAAVLGNLLSRLTDRSQLMAQLKAYENLRVSRVRRIQQEARYNRGILHMRDGESQRERDKSMEYSMQQRVLQARGEQGDDCVGNANIWADKSRADALFGYDAEKIVEDWFRHSKPKGEYSRNFNAKL